MKTLAQDVIELTQEGQLDQEDIAIAKLAVEQTALLKDMRTASSYLLDKAKAYDQWLKKNQVQAILGKEGQGYADQMKDNFDKINDIV